MSRGLEEQQECWVLLQWIYILDLEQKLQNRSTALLSSSFHNTQTAVLWLSSHLYKTYQPSSSTETDKTRYSSWLLLLMSDKNQLHEFRNCELNCESFVIFFSSPSFQHSVVHSFSPYSTCCILSPGHWWPSIDGPASCSQCEEDTWACIVVGSCDEHRYVLCWRNRDGQVESWCMELSSAS